MSIGAKPWKGSGGAVSVPDASETTKGKIRIATSAEATTGTDDLTAMTPLTVKERIDAALVGGVEYKGTFNATAGTPSLATAEKGDLYIVGTAGTIYGQTWAVGDHLLINDNMGGSIDNAKIDKVDNTDAVTSVNTQTGAVVLSANDLAADYTPTSYLPSNTNIDGHLEGIDDEFLLTATLADPAFTGTPTAPTATQGDNSTQIATTAYVDTAVSAGGASDASETVKGIIEIATNTEAQAASATDKALVPSNIGSIDVGSFNDDSTYQPLDAGLTSISGLTTSADKFLYTTASDTYAVASISAAGRSFVSANDAGAQRSALNLGTAATSDSSDFLASTAAVGDLSDVSITSVSNGQVLSYNSTSGDWENTTPASGGLASVSADTDPTLGGDLKVGGFAITSTSNGDVTLDPNGTGDVVLGADLMPDADATHYIGDENTRFISAYTDINGAIRFKAKNDQGASISKGQAVYIKGVSGTVPTVGLARANSASTMPAFGLALTDANDQAEVQVVSFGNLTDYNTTTYSLSAGDTVFVSAATAGALTSSAPAGESNLIQNIGRVVRADASAGIVKVGGAGRSNATPNLDQNKIFVGNASNQAVSTALSAIDVGSFNDDSTYQPLDAGLTSISGLTTAANKMIYTTGSDTYAVADLTAAGRAILDDADAVAQRTTLGLGTAATSASSDFLASTAGLNDLADVSFTAGAGIDNYILTYDNSTTSWGAEAAPTAAAASETQAGVIEIATNAEAQAASATNKALVPSNIGSIDTGDLNDDGTFLKDLSADSSPQLGGDLDLNGSDIITTSNADLDLAPNGTGVVVIRGNTNSGALKLNCENNSHGVTIKGPPHSAAATYTLTLPNNDGDANQVLQTDGSGVLSWVAQSGGGSSPPDLTPLSPSANYTINTHEGIEEIYKFTPSASISVLLPSAASCGTGYKYHLKNMSTYTITVDPDGSETIDGSSTYSLNVQYMNLTLCSDGTNWIIL